jgi:hypothetical protein
MLTIYNAGAFSTQYINTGTGGATWQIGATSNDYGSGGGKFVFTYGAASLNSILTLIQATKNVSIGTTDDVSRLYVVGAHTSGRGIISVNSSDIAYLHLSSTSASATDVAVRYAKSDVEKWVLGMVGGGATDYTFRLTGSGLASNVFNVNLATGLTTYNYAVTATDALIATGSDTTGTRVSIFNTSVGGILWNIFSGGSAATLGAAGNLIFRNSTAGATRMSLSPGGVLRLNAYGSGGITGSPTRYLAVDVNGDVIETTGGAGSQWTTTGSGIYYNGAVSIATTQFSTNSKLLVGDYLSLGTSAIAQFNGFIRVKDQIILHNTSNIALESYIQCQAANSLTTDGNFSLGTTATSTKLTVYQNSSSTTTIDQGITIGNGNGTTGVMAAVKFGTYGDLAGSTAYAKQFIAGWRNADGAGFGDLILGNYKGDDGLGVARYEDTAIKIKKSGNVIVGAFDTTDIQPTFATVRLQVNGSLYISNTAADAGQWINGGTGAWSFIQYSNLGTNKFIEGYRDADALYHIAPGASLATNTGLNMNSGGRIHIGGNSFTGLLTISGAHPGGFGMLRLISSDVCIIDMDSQSYDNRLRHKINGVDTWFIGMLDSTTIKWTDSGNNAKLTLTTGGTLTATADVVAYSDVRLKADINTIDDALNKVLSLRGVYYTRIDLEDKSRKIGVIAQETEKILPELITVSSDGILGVSYGNMSGVFIEAFKEQQKQIEELKSIIDALTK